MINSFITAIRTLTRIPMRGKDTTNFASSLFWFPVVGFLLAVILSLFTWMQNISNWNESIAFMIILAGTMLTGALHLDGFADWADSLGAIPNRKKMLLIMKDSNNGAFGVVALVLLLLAKWIVLTQLLNLGLASVGIFTAYISSRFALVYFSAMLPYARAEGGTGGPIINGANGKHIAVAIGETIVLLFVVGNISALVIFSLLFLVMLLWKRWCEKYFNGITGDLLGAGSEIIETTTLFFVAQFYTIIEIQLKQLLTNL